MRPLNPLEPREIDPAVVPFWGTRGFRRMLLVLIGAVTFLLVLIFDILPKFMNPPPGRSVGKRDGQVAPTHPKRTGPKPVRFDGMLDKVQDGTPIDMFDTPFRHMMDFLSKSDPKDLAKEINVEVPYADLKAEPGEWRSESIRVIGLLGDLRPIRLDPPQGSIEFLYRVVVTDLSGEEGYMAYLVRRPDSMKPRELVQMDGVFLKMGTYDGLKGPVLAPVILGWDLVPVKEKAPDQTLDGSKLIMLLGTAALLLVLLMTFQALRKERIVRRPVPRMARPPAAAPAPAPAAPASDVLAAVETPKPPTTA